MKVEAKIMNYINKISSVDNFYYIKLPKKTSMVYLDINLKSGYAEENNKEFGTSHLLEHYLIGTLKKSENSKDIKIGGSIRQESITYSLDSSVSKIVDEAQIFIKSILSPEFSDEQIFQSEKEALINELYIKLNDYHNLLEEAVLRERVDKKCPYVRNTKDCIRNITKINLKDLQKYHRKFFRKGNLVITLSAYQLEPNIIETILSIIKKYKLKKYKLSREPLEHHSNRCLYSGFKIKKIKNNDRLELSTVAITFPAYEEKTKPARRITLDILGHLLSDASEGLLNDLRKIGIYSLDFKKITWKNMGVIYFYSSVMNKKLLSFLRLMNEAIKRLKIEEIPKSKLNFFKKQIKKSEEKAFNNNVDRISWINYDLIHYGRLMPLEEDIKIIDKITTKIIKAAARDIFKNNLANIIIIGRDVGKIDVNKIKKVIDF